MSPFRGLCSGLSLRLACSPWTGAERPLQRACEEIADDAVAVCLSAVPPVVLR